MAVFQGMNILETQLLGWDPFTGGRLLKKKTEDMDLWTEIFVCVGKMKRITIKWQE